MQEVIRAVSVVLNFNSSHELCELLPQLEAQRGVPHAVIVVDNASRSEEVSRAKEIFSQTWPYGLVGSTAEITASIKHAVTPSRAYLVLHEHNGGYSAGNNVGIRLAEELGAAAVLIANPDMRLEDPNYVAQLYETLVGERSNLIAASRIVGLNGLDQSPLRELSYWEELLWPIFALRNKLFKPSSHVVLPPGNQPAAVRKVSGCCLMLRLDFLRGNGYLDEGVFLYCEEPILAEKVRRAGGHIVFQPHLLAVHAHRKSIKGNPSRNMLQHIKSRCYYLRHYSNYRPIARACLFVSYALLRFAHLIRLRFF